MLRTRLVMGSILIVLTIGMLFLDSYFPPYYPFLAAVVFLFGTLGTIEFLRLVPKPMSPRPWICLPAVLVVLGLNWLSTQHDRGGYAGPLFRFLHGIEKLPQLTLTVCVAVFLSVLVVEILVYRGSGSSLQRIALAMVCIFYLGVLPSYLVVLRMPPFPDQHETFASEKSRTFALALAIFVPKMCDTGAYFTGRLIGRHKMTPVLSPKKTWEGAAGGLLLAVITTAVIQYCDPVIPGGWFAVVLFGLVVGTAGILGDLAESLIKRDCQQKDASQTVPGFGGVLDVVDSILFAAPVVYWWLR